MVGLEQWKTILIILKDILLIVTHYVDYYLLINIMNMTLEIIYIILLNYRKYICYFVINYNYIPNKETCSTNKTEN